MTTTSFFSIPDDKYFFLIAPETITAGGGAGTNTFDGLDDEATAYDEAAWNGATAYNVDDRVSYNYSIYIRLEAGTTGTAPDADETNWLRVSPINAFKMFDQTNSTQTQILPSGATFEVQLASGRYCDTVIFDACENIETITLNAYDASDNLVFGPNTVTMVGAGVMNETDIEYHWAKRRAAIFMGLPGIVDSVDELRLSVTVDVDDLAEPGKIGTMMVGNRRRIGVAKAGFGTGIADRSIKEADEFGNYNITERAYSDRVSGVVAINSRHVQGIKNLLATYRATMAGYLVAGDTHGMAVLGFFKNFSIVVDGPTLSFCDIEIEGI